MKAISVAMQAHLDSVCTTLATIWRIFRRDGVVLYSTDHDLVLNYGGKAYLPTLGHTRKALDQSSSTSVNNFDIQGILDIDDPTEEDVRAGLYNMAILEMAMVNWNDLTMGEIPLFWGIIGEISIKSEHEYEAEILGPMALLQQNMIEISQADCRADLGDSMCKIPIYPQELERNQDIVLGQYYRKKTLLQGAYWENGLTNASFELQGVTGVVTSVTGWTVASGNWRLLDVGAHNRDIQLVGGTSASGELYQDVDLVALGATVANVDTGDFEVRFSGWRNNYSGSSDLGRIVVEAQGAGHAVLATMLDTGNETFGGGVWTERSFARTPVPAGTRYIRVRLLHTQVSPTTSDAKFDDFILEMWDNVALQVYVNYWTNTLNNVGFEADPAINPVTKLTNWQVVSGIWALYTTFLGLNPHSGTKFLEGGAQSGEIRQDLFLSGLKISDAAIDNGQVQFFFSIWRANSAVTDTGRVLVQGLTTAGTVVQTLYDTGTETISPITTWQQRSNTGVVSAGVRIIRVRLFANRVSGIGANVDFDDVELSITDFSTIREDWGLNEDVVYLATQAGITDTRSVNLNSAIGNATTDGTAILVAQDSFMRGGYITEVIDPSQVKISVNEPRAVDDWFNYGGLVFETGQNRTVCVEVQDWIAATGTVQFFLPPPYVPKAGERIRIYTGCDKRLDTCNDKFNNIVNFRGEPFDPGSDFFTQYLPG